MTTRVQLFQSQRARQSFWLLLMITLLLIVASVTVVSSYLFYARYHVSHSRLTNQIVKDVILARALPIRELPNVIQVLGGEGVRVQMAALPDNDSQIVQLTDAASLRDLVDRSNYHLNLSVLLANGQWLNIRAHQFPYRWLLVGLLVSLSIILLAVIFSCLMIIKRMDTPIRTFIAAAKRFGRDVEAPPLAPMGSEEVQEVVFAFNQMQDRIRRLLHDRTQMLAAISHDLRTPITRLQLRAEYLQGTNQYEKAVADLQEMENMIASILSFARDHVRHEKMEWFDLNALLETICDEMTDLGFAVTYDSELARVPYFARIGALKRAFTNLIDNAIKYGKRAAVLLKKTERGWLIKISDEGPGIPPQELEKVFAPFYRVDPARSPQQKGTGLGLAVARDIVRAHGGDIVLHSEEARGLIVIITLPFTEQAQELS